MSEWDKRFAVRWREAFIREFGTGKVAAQQLSDLGIHPTTIKTWTSKGGRPTVANLCLVARKARDPSAFIAEICADELWARELAVAVQRRRLGDAEAALAACRTQGDQDPLGVIRRFVGPARAIWLLDDQGRMTLATQGPDAEAQRILGGDWDGEGTALDSLLRNRGWVLIEQDEDQPPVIHCHAVSASARAFDALMTWLEQEPRTQGMVLRVFIIDWVDVPCSSLYQLQGELDRVQHMQAAIARDRWAADATMESGDGSCPDSASTQAPSAVIDPEGDPGLDPRIKDGVVEDGVAGDRRNDGSGLVASQELVPLTGGGLSLTTPTRVLSSLPRWRVAAFPEDRDGGLPGPDSERLSLEDAPRDGHAFWTLWRQCGGIVGGEMIHNLETSRMFDLVGIYGVLDQQFRVGFVGTRLRLPVGMTREKITGHDILEIQAPSGYGPLIASNFALAAHERIPVVHRIRVTSRRSYRRVSFPIFDHRGRRVVAIIGFSDARITEDTS